MAFGSPSAERGMPSKFVFGEVALGVTSRRSLRFVGAGMAVALVTIAAVKSYAAADCEYKRMQSEAMQHQLAAALVDTEQCLATHRQRLGSGGAERILEVAQVAYYLYARAQLLAMQGDLDRAQTAFLSANDFASSEGLLANPVSMAPSVPGATEGYILERRGDLKGALDRYLATYVYGRAALVALALKDDALASQYAARAAPSYDPDSHLVLGLLAEKSGKRLDAREHFNQARTLLFTQLDQNPIEPLYFAEWPQIEQGLTRTQ